MWGYAEVGPDIYGASCGPFYRSRSRLLIPLQIASEQKETCAPRQFLNQWWNGNTRGRVIAKQGIISAGIGFAFFDHAKGSVVQMGLFLKQLDVAGG